MKFLILNGPNLNLLGVREPSIYGSATYNDMLREIQAKAKELGVDVACYQTNHEGEMVDKIQDALGNVDGIIINPAAYTHTSIAILDALKAVDLPAVEVHLSDITKRESFRQISYAGMACQWHFAGLGKEGYFKGLEVLKQHFLENAPATAPSRPVPPRPNLLQAMKEQDSVAAPSSSKVIETLGTELEGEEHYIPHEPKPRGTKK